MVTHGFINHRHLHKTLAYLILPSKSSDLKREENADSEGSEDERYFSSPRVRDSIHSCLIDPASLSLTDEHKRRFATAMRILQLDVSIPHGQFKHEVSASAPFKSFNKPFKSARLQEYMSRESQKRVIEKIDQKHESMLPGRLVVRERWKLTQNIEHKNMEWPRLTMIVRNGKEFARLGYVSNG